MKTKKSEFQKFSYSWLSYACLLIVSVLNFFSAVDKQLDELKNQRHLLEPRQQFTAELQEMSKVKSPVVRSGPLLIGLKLTRVLRLIVVQVLTA